MSINLYNNQKEAVMVARSITFQKTAKNDVSLCIETSFGFEVVVINEQQALALSQDLRDTLAAMPSRFGREKTGFLGITPYALRAGSNSV